MSNGVTIPLGDGISVTGQFDGNKLTLVIGLKNGSECVLHWGISDQVGGPWKRPPEACWPRGTTATDGPAVRTPFSRTEKGEGEVTLHFDLPLPAKRLAFVLHFPRENRWVNQGGGDFSIPLRARPGTSSAEEALQAWAPGGSVIRQTFPLDGGEQLAVATTAGPDSVRVQMVSSADLPLLLHWGLTWLSRHEWQLPPEPFRPAGTTLFGEQAARTPFVERDGWPYLEMTFPAPAEGPAPQGMQFVLFQPEGSAWLKSSGKELTCPLFQRPGGPRLGSSRLRDRAEQIIAAEKGASSWTLMHRYNLCHDLLAGAEQDEDALALLFAWLRYSNIRQLDWQRNYNTKPRELAAAQDRLTRRLAGIWKQQPPATGSGVRAWLRLMLSTLGRGGEGQKVRDEILHIMHRNNLKETSGSFVEEWHQKLHNNTTPDDVVICEAYLAFLESDGDLEAFDSTLKAGGVTRERLQGFERPIKTDPTFDAGKKDALIKEFEGFLRILRSVHSGTDLESSIAAARPVLSEDMRKKLEGLLPAEGKPGPTPPGCAALHPGLSSFGSGNKAPGGAQRNPGSSRAVSAREELRKAITAAKDDGGVRDLLFLDLALEDLVRAQIERQNLSQLERDPLVELVQEAMRNLFLSVDDPELAICLANWDALRKRPRDGRDWALHSRSVLDRASRWVQSNTQGIYQRLQPKAELLGTAFEAEKWTIPLFSEEVIRGGPAFALAQLVRPLDRVLRQQAGLGGWQVISSARAFGRVRVVDKLLAVQGERFSEATVLVADQVSGSEEIPEGVTAVLTCDTPDLVSHVAVRARNAHVLFASCFEPSLYEQVKQLKDRSVLLQVTPGGDVDFEESSGNGAPKEVNGKAKHAPPPIARVRTSSQWVLNQDQFTPEWVGGKSNNLNGLRGRLDGWINLPTSLALPFGTFEKALEAQANQELRRKYQALLETVEQNPPEVLAQVRSLLLELAPPAGLKEALLDTWQRAGLPPVPWEQAWTGIRRVWASKWNDRAYLSRRARGVPHDSLTMAVLIQQVVPADYAFVIHTRNPVTGNNGEVFAEMVLGLGETLVGNYPGQALGFVCQKADLKLELLSYPGKSVGLYGKGVIFRSDSNGEDLEDFAGAGLYDSFLAEEPEQRRLDYRDEKLVWDKGFREEVLRSVARIGLEVEGVLGSAQDIEGAVAGGKSYVVQTRPQVGLSDG